MCRSQKLIRILRGKQVTIFLKTICYFTDLLPGGALRPGLLLGGVAPVDAAVGVDLQDVGRARDDAQALVTFGSPIVVNIAAAGEDDVAAEPPVAGAPAGDGVEEDGDRVVGDLPRGHGLRQELALELHGEVAAGPD